MTLDTLADVASAICLLGGSFLVVASGLGAVTFTDVLARVHAAAKPQVLGVLAAMVGLALRLRDAPTVWMLWLAAIFVLLTAPVSGHMLSRAALRNGRVPPGNLVVDELSADLRHVRSRVAEHDQEEGG